jgi:hypothetical protein
MMMTVYPKRIEFKEATLRFGRRRILIFEVFLGLHRKREGEEGGTLDSVYGSHLTSRNLDNFQSAYNNLKYSKGNKYKKI